MKVSHTTLAMAKKERHRLRLKKLPRLPGSTIGYKLSQTVRTKISTMRSIMLDKLTTSAEQDGILSSEKEVSD